MARLIGGLGHGPTRLVDLTDVEGDFAPGDTPVKTDKGVFVPASLTKPPAVPPGQVKKEN